MAEPKPSFFDHIPALVRLALVLGIAVALVYLLYVQVFSPKLALKRSLDTQITGLDQQAAQMEAQVRAHPPVTAAERAEWDRTQAQLEERIPPDYRLPELIEQIAILAKKYSLEDILISTNEKVALVRPPDAEIIGRSAAGPAVTSAAQARALQAQQAGQQAQRRPVHITDIISAGYYPITITFHGTFRNQAQFLEDLAKLQQLVELDTMEISRQYPETSFRLILKAFHSGKVTRA